MFTTCTHAPLHRGRLLMTHPNAGATGSAQRCIFFYFFILRISTPAVLVLLVNIIDTSSHAKFIRFRVFVFACGLGGGGAEPTKFVRRLLSGR